MKTLSEIVLHGSRCGRATGWQTWPGFGMLHFSDGSTRYLPSGQDNIVSGIQVAKALGVDTSDFERRMSEAEKRLAYPPKPETAELYLHGYGYERPIIVGDWQWSTTFGRWGRHVVFADGWSGFTYPKTW